jgi:putative FmdB family regulatory protein
MPIYEYQCPTCGLKEEILQPMDAPTTLECERCLTPMPRIQSRTTFKMEPDK